ncbi:HER155Wp [Eremothecium sinecaudum]|uniref:HER155Wp n=1 Tax=Eremothecium sinecaudum TaxID=45286 RepID=A0A0X8HTY4_9SACH|nr:HER155Wp [Eremothecium sinecaudum]AMD21434.1 HER155Wp [Eremothecium sinecaudum]
MLGRLLPRSSNKIPYTALLRTQKTYPSPLYKRSPLLAKRYHYVLQKPKKGEELNVTFILKDGSQKTFQVCEGDSVLDIAQSNNLDMEGACGGSCACSTCHVIVDPDYYDLLEEPNDDENDMLDLAYGLTETSRLGCCIKMNKKIDGIRLALPAMTRNVNLSDFE